MTLPDSPREAQERLERARFQEWFEADAMPCEAHWFRREDDGSYYHQSTNSAWKGWRARAGLPAED